MSNVKYRPDIDGLRGLAVLIIIIFHFNKTLLPSGFIGVDIFFVISGFIITSAIYPQMQLNAFSFSDFYNKRIKRILPLFYFVVLTSTMLAYFIFAPNDFVSFADSVRYSSAFISNIYFERNTGYFANTSETMPLLNIWSLSVEEQFYLIWPILLLGLTRFLSSKIAAGFLIVLMIILISYSHFLAVSFPSEAYFLIQSRGFELLIGAVLSIGMIKSQQKGIEFRPRTYQIVGIIGLAITLVMLLTLDKENIFPSYNAALVCLGAALIIFSGCDKSTFTNKMLSRPLLVYIGRMSYSLYLWHWPVQSFYRYYYDEFGVQGFVISSVLTVLFSVASYHLIENPFRYATLKKRTVYVCYFILPITALILMAKNIDKKEGYPERFTEEARQFYLLSTSDFVKEQNNPLQIEGFDPFSPMIIGKQDANVPSAFIWGDSHANHFRSFVDELGKEYGFSALFSTEGGCPPIAEGGIIKRGKPEENCEKSNKMTLARILKSDAKIVFLAGRWAVYTETTRPKNEVGSDVFLADQKDKSESAENSRRVLTEGLEKTISTLIAYGKTPIIFSQVPSYSFKPSNCLFKKMTVKSMKDRVCDLDNNEFVDRYRFARAFFRSMKEKYPQMVIIDVQPLVCSGGTCVSQLDGIPLYKDDDHLNSQGARKLYKEYIKTPAADELKQRLGDLFRGEIIHADGVNAPQLGKAQ